VLTAQVPFRVTRHVGLPSTPGMAAIAVGDVDGDDDADIVVGCSADHTNLLLLNDGQGRFTDQTLNRFVTPAGPNSTHGIDLVDVDGDGDLDVLSSNAQNLTNRLYLNDGSGFFLVMTAVLLPANAATTVDQVVGDFDGDGDADWFMANRPGAQLWLNAGGVFQDVSASHLVGLPPSLGYWYSHSSAADLDGDGDLDLLLAAYPVPVILWNQGNAVFGTATPLSIPAYFFGTNRAADLDGDGDLDLLLDNAGYVLLNLGTGNFVNATAAAFGGVPVSSPAAFDADGDSFLDVLTATTLWHNDGNARFTPQALPVNVGLVSILHTIAADFDGDGDLEPAGLVNFSTQVDAPVAPVIGQWYSVDFHVRAGPPSVVVALASWGGAAVPVGPLGTLRLDTAQMLTLTVQPVAASPLTLSWPIPNWPALAGVSVHYQALIVDPSGGMHFSNGLHDVVQ
jgi:hypothetical protein